VYWFISLLYLRKTRGTYRVLEGGVTPMAQDADDAVTTGCARQRYPGRAPVPPGDCVIRPLATRATRGPRAPRRHRPRRGL